MADLREIVAALQEQRQPEIAAMGSTLPDVGAPLVPDGGQFSAGTRVGNKAADIGSKLAYGAMGSIATLPQRAIENSQYALDTGNYDPGPAIEAAMLPMGTGAIAGVPVRGGEAVLGAGPIRRLQPDVGVVQSGMTERPTSIFDTISEKYPQVKIDGSPARSSSDYATLSRIAVPPELRGQGLATQAMRDLITEADKSGTNLALSPSADWGASKARLQDFYSRFGFVPNVGRMKDFATRETMIRTYKPSSE